MLLYEVFDRDSGHALAVFAHRDDATRLVRSLTESQARPTEALEVIAVDDYGHRFPCDS